MSYVTLSMLRGLVPQAYGLRGSMASRNIGDNAFTSLREGSIASTQSSGSDVSMIEIIDARTDKDEYPLEDMMNLDPPKDMPVAPAAPIASPPSSPRSGCPISIDDFDLLKKVGSGGFGQVYYAKHRESDTFHAVKVVRKAKISASGLEEQIYAEQATGELLDEVGDPALLSLRASFQDTENYYFVTPFMHGGDLARALHESPGNMFDDWRAHELMVQLVHGLSVVHAHKIIHRDIKPDNIFFDANGHAVLGDWGLARLFEDFEQRFEGMTEAQAASRETTDDFCGTSGYIAPELLDSDAEDQGSYSYPADIFALGVTMHEVHYGEAPFDGEDAEEMSFLTVHMPPAHPTRAVWPPAMDLMNKMMEKDPKKRIDIEGIKGHHYFAGVDWNCVAGHRFACRYNTFVREEFDAEMSRHRPIKIRIGKKYDLAHPDPYFTYISPQWQCLLRSATANGVQSDNDAVAADDIDHSEDHAIYRYSDIFGHGSDSESEIESPPILRNVKLMFKGMEIQEFKVPVKLKASSAASMVVSPHLLEPVPTLPKIKIKLLRQSEQRLSTVSFSSDNLDDVRFDGSTACNTACNTNCNTACNTPIKDFFKDPLEAAYDKGKDKALNLSPIFVPIPSTGCSPPQESLSPFGSPLSRVYSPSSSLSSALWLETPAESFGSIKLKTQASEFDTCIGMRSHTTRKLKLSSISVPADWKVPEYQIPMPTPEFEINFDLEFPDPLPVSDVDFSRFDSPGSSSSSMYAMDVDAPGNAQEVFHCPAGMNDFLGPFLYDTPYLWNY